MQYELASWRNSDFITNVSLCFCSFELLLIEIVGLLGKI